MKHQPYFDIISEYLTCEFGRRIFKTGKEVPAEMLDRLLVEINKTNQRITAQNLTKIEELASSNGDYCQIFALYCFQIANN